MAAPVPDLKIAVNVDVTVDTSVQALVTWTQPMDIRPTSYKVRWNRVSCQVETEAPGCWLRSEQGVASIKATVEPVSISIASSNMARGVGHREVIHSYEPDGGNTQDSQNNPSDFLLPLRFRTCSKDTCMHFFSLHFSMTLS